MCLGDCFLWFLFIDWYEFTCLVVITLLCLLLLCSFACVCLFDGVVVWVWVFEFGFGLVVCFWVDVMLGR